MNLFKRALLYSMRQKLKSSILFGLVTVMITFVIIGIAIYDASEHASYHVRSSVSGVIHLQIDDSEQNMTSSENQWGTTYSYNGDYITNDIIEAISKVNGVVDYASENASGFWGAAVDFNYLPAQFNISYTEYGAASGFNATLSSKRCSEFSNGKYTLVDGRHIASEDSHVVMISKELADYNSLSVGDYVTMYCLDSDSQVSLEIVGIFSGTEGMGNNALSISDLPANQGFVDYDTMFENFGRELDGYNEIDIYVEDPEGIHNVYNEIKNLSALKNKTLALSINTEDYNTISNPLEHLKEMVQTLLILIVCVSIIILTLLLMIWTRGRKREIGILLSIGESRRSIMTQFFAEVMMIGLFAFGASICLSNAISGIASEFLIAQVDSSVENLKLVISVQQVLPVYISSCVIILLSVVVASWSVLRLNPRDIFAKMS